MLITLPSLDELAIHGMVEDAKCLEEDRPDALWNVTIIFYSMRQSSEQRWLDFVKRVSKGEHEPEGFEIDIDGPDSEELILESLPKRDSVVPPSSEEEEIELEIDDIEFDEKEDREDESPSIDAPDTRREQPSVAPTRERPSVAPTSVVPSGSPSEPPSSPIPVARDSSPGSIVPVEPGDLAAAEAGRTSGLVPTSPPRDSRPPWADERAPIVSNSADAVTSRRRTAIPPPEPPRGAATSHQIEQLSPRDGRGRPMPVRRRSVQRGAVRPTPAALSRTLGASPVVYKIPLPTLEAMAGFAEAAFRSRGVVVRTDDLRGVGTPVVVCVVHALSKDEFHLPGEVVRHFPERPGVAVGFTKLNRKTIAEFHRFVANGIPDEWPEWEGWVEQKESESFGEEQRNLSYVDEYAKRKMRETSPHTIPADTKVLRESMIVPLEKILKK